MDILKLITLTLLIPLGWTFSVDACPQPVNDFSIVSTPAPALTCHAKQDPHQTNEKHVMEIMR